MHKKLLFNGFNNLQVIILFILSNRDRINSIFILLKLSFNYHKINPFVLNFQHGYRQNLPFLIQIF